MELSNNGYAEPSIDITSVNPYVFVTHSYYGTGGYVDGSYLQKFDRELNFKKRKQSAFYTNMIKGVADSIVTPVFIEEPIRSTDNDIFADFIQNCDNKGNGLTSVTETVVKYARLHGICFGVVDNFAEVPELQVDVLAERKYPYLYIKTADTVADYKVDEFGILKSITFIDAIVTIDKKNHQTYRVWTDTYSQLLIKKGKKIEEYGEKKYHDLGIVPVVPCRLDSVSDDFLPFPAFYDISKLNCAIYNLDSEITSVGKQQGFSLLVIPSDDPKPNIEVGADSVLTVPTASTIMPDFISPDSSIMTVLQNRATELKQSLLSTANVIGATAIGGSNQAKSGVALSYEFLGQSISLEKSARMGESFEYAVSIIVGLYVDQEIDYKVEYSTNFTPSVAETTAKFDILERLFNMNASDAINNSAKYFMVEVLSDLFPMEDEDIEKLKDIISGENGNSTDDEE